MSYGNPESSLESWLARLEKQHPRSIELGLERVAAVYARLGFIKPARQVITVAGTNGKGSTVAYVNALATAAGLHCGSYTSPHLIRFNERIVIDGTPVSDAELCGAFEEVEAALNGVSLTYFEFTTLAALLLFSRAGLDLAILEVGLGGRLDAVNIIDPDVSVITSIGIDHQDWLGDDRELIGFEKAGIIRNNTPVICGERKTPESVSGRAAALAAPMQVIGVHYGHVNAVPAMPGPAQRDNLATALTALKALPDPPVVSASMIRQAAMVSIPGRFAKLADSPDVFVDVAHNVQAAGQLARCIEELGCRGKRWFVLAMLADKQAEQVAKKLDHLAGEWYLAGLGGPRGLTAQELHARISGRLLAPVKSFDTVTAAIEQALSKAREVDQVIIFGSFLTVAEAIRYWNR